MSPALILLALIAAEPGAGHARNPIYAGLIGGAPAVEGSDATLPPPRFPDGLDAGAERAALRDLIGSDRGVDEFLRDSIAAPHILKVRDAKAEGATVRLADLWFAVRADLDAIDPTAAAIESAGKPTEAGNMRFETSFVPAAPPVADATRQEWHSRVHGRLLGRIAVEATDHVVATRSADSWIIAARTDRAFDRNPDAPNRWSTLAGATPGPAQPFAGSASYAKITRLRSAPGVLLVECHFAFVEPTAWFDGNPILRSKIGLVAQDQVRRLRRELADRKAKP